MENLPTRSAFLRETVKVNARTNKFSQALFGDVVEYVTVDHLSIII